MFLCRSPWHRLRQRQRTPLRFSPLFHVAPILSRQWNLFRYTDSVLALFTGHSFGIIPAPGSFASSAFPVPPNKSFETAPKISCIPPKKQPLTLGAVSTCFRVPQLQGQKQEKKSCT